MSCWHRTRFFRLSTWQQQAKDAGNTVAEKKNNFHNLMMLITYWGEHVTSEDNLHDYAYKEWAGMMNTYYKERWLVYFDYLRALLAERKRKRPIISIGNANGWKRICTWRTMRHECLWKKL